MRSLDENDLVLIPPGAAQRQTVSPILGIESEILIKISADYRVGHRQTKMLQRMNGHGSLPLKIPNYAGVFRIFRPAPPAWRTIFPDRSRRNRRQAEAPIGAEIPGLMH